MFAAQLVVAQLVAAQLVVATLALDVGVVGGGVAGLSCARRLQELGIVATVFDTGKRAPGGRACSRMWRGHVVDHAAQFITARDAEFARHMAALERDGMVRRMGSDELGVVRQPGVAEPFDSSELRYVVHGGLGAFAASAADGLDVRQDVWVSPNGGIRFVSGGGWLLQESREVERAFDAIVIAHNGKCAERLTSTQPALDVHALLRARFAPALPKGGDGGGGRFTLNSMYSLLVEVPVGTLPSSLGVAAFVECEPALRFLSNNGAKHAEPGKPRETEVWTVLSSGQFGKKHKAPQEFLSGTPKEEEVVSLMLAALARAAGCTEDSLSSAVIATKLQLWGAALPLNCWSGGACAFNARYRIGVCGDWFRAGDSPPSTIESAWLSGRALAERLAQEAASAEAGDDYGDDVGLALGPGGGQFVPIDSGFGDGAANGASAQWLTTPAAGASSRAARGRGRGAGRRAQSPDSARVRSGSRRNTRSRNPTS